MFTIALTNVLVTLCYILPGFLLGKMKKADGNHLSTLSAVLVYVCSPCMIIGAGYGAKSLRGKTGRYGAVFRDRAVFADSVYGHFVPYFPQKVRRRQVSYFYDSVRYGQLRIFRVADSKSAVPRTTRSSMSYSCIASVALNVLSFTVGVFCVTGDKGKVNIVKGIFNPNTVGLIAGLLLAFFNVREHLPSAFVNALRTGGQHVHARLHDYSRSAACMRAVRKTVCPPVRVPYMPYEAGNFPAVLLRRGIFSAARPGFQGERACSHRRAVCVHDTQHCRALRRRARTFRQQRAFVHAFVLYHHSAAYAAGAMSL